MRYPSTVSEVWQIFTDILQNDEKTKIVNKMLAKLLVGEIIDSRLLSKYCAKSIVTHAIEQGENMKNINYELQNARPTKDIPGPKALPLIGNWFRFIPYIGKILSLIQTRQFFISYCVILSCSD